ncbi:DUF962-domain-containing protein [Punctularia strigosozonata HHB-11173 SS5]|uniref:DUF962-domain-containing protein n=1 Tax=Punctularia strigosozonata (strain HHB-11173) TaxID=741275 RepID=UPI0004418131|nr:DUF962-domain-containing protein [Punctularia strigosozonata HHB-11173 SS5]EIN10393.1 DUF962-domain-containing protein [Punctularia strigosozonata HHB-11173 SS5]
MAVGLFDVRKQLTFYGAYHSNHTNVLIHMCCVPVLLWTFQAMITRIPTPSWMPRGYTPINDYMAVEMNWTTTFTVLYLLYYYILEPTAALIYTPQLVLSWLTATSFAHRNDIDNLTIAGIINGVCWIAQFIGHGKFEHRAPALLDNIVGALVLAPFFVHLELLFSLGWRKDFHKELNNEIGKEITRIRKAEGDKKRAKEAAKKEL